jgi:hypothetical protein
MPGAFKAGDLSNQPLFGLRSGIAVNVAVFAAKVGSVERGYILLMPQGHARKLLVVISHTFGQNDAYYSDKGYSDPLSPDLIKDVLDRFVIERWGAQIMCASSDYALLMPVRAKAGGGASELGPFVAQPGVGAAIVAEIAAQSGKVFEFSEVAIVTFSSGISDCNLFIAAGGAGLNFTRGINQDPAGGSGDVGRGRHPTAVSQRPDHAWRGPRRLRADATAALGSRAKLRPQIRLGRAQLPA